MCVGANPPAHARACAASVWRCLEAPPTFHGRPLGLKAVPVPRVDCVPVMGRAPKSTAPANHGSRSALPSLPDQHVVVAALRDAEHKLAATLKVGRHSCAVYNLRVA